jgi:acyl-CoA dehydrogenase
MGQAASPLCALYLDEMRARADEVVGGVGGGFKLAMEIFNRSRQTIAAQAVGVARRAMEIAVDYANTRRTMGRPIIEHQAIGFLLAEMDVRIRAARLLTHEAAWLADVGRADRVAAARAKAFAADACMAVTTDAVQVLGGYGYMREYHVEKLMRDAKVMQIYEGTSQIQRLIIARSLSTASREEPGATIVDGARASAR